MQHDKFQQCALLELNRMLDEEIKNRSQNEIIRKLLKFQGLVLPF